jgi:hypothetical protein
MRVIPYFQSVPVRRPATAGNARLEPGKAAAPKVFDLPREVAGAEKPGEDRFIPSSPVTGVVFPIRQEPVLQSAGTRVAQRSIESPGVVKSGNYNLYRLDGRLEQTQPPVKGEKLDLRS